MIKASVNKIATSSKPTRWLFYIFLLLATSALAQQQETKYKRFRTTPLPVIYYSPETKFGFGALLAINFDTQKIPDSTTRSSYSQTYVLYTVNKQYEFGQKTRIYFPNNDYILEVNLNHLYFPEFYFGVNTELPLVNKDTIEYNRSTIQAQFYKRLGRYLYVGLGARYQQIRNVVNPNGGPFTDQLPEGGGGYKALGLAPAITYESRDSQIFPRKGWFVESQFYLYPCWNSTFTRFSSIKIDARRYFPINLTSSRDVFAVQLVTVMTGGDVPFKDMADVGGPSIMRGYYRGFYRYLNSYSLQAELRLGLGNYIGLVSWAGLSLTSERWYDILQNPAKPNAGIGLRFMINRKDRLNIRVDQGFGKKGQNGFYLDLSEAF